MTLFKTYCRALILIISLSIISNLHILPAYGEENKSLRVNVDPRIELLAVVQHLSGYGERFDGRITRFDIDYKMDIEEYFDDYRDHKAVNMFSDLAGSFNCDAPPNMMLHLSDPPKLDILLPFTDYLAERAKGRENLDKFTGALRDFAIESHFMDFFNAHQNEYDEMVAGVLNTIGDENYVATIENYFGMQNHSYSIILAPMFHYGGYGPHVEREDGSLDLFYIGGPKGIENGKPTFGTSWEFRHYAWHEFSHPFVNRLTAKHIDEVNKYKWLFDPIKPGMKSQAYTTWETCFNEHVVRAVVARLTKLHIGHKEYREVLREEKYNYFSYIGLIEDALRLYEHSRTSCPTFEEAYSIIFEFLPMQSESTLDDWFYSMPFRGRFDRICMDKRKLVIILPTNESDKIIQDKLHEYVRDIEEMLRDPEYGEIDILLDTDALASDLSLKNILVYGTLEGNLWLKEHFSWLDRIVKPDVILTDKVHFGRDLRFIMSWPSPLNPHKGVGIYAAQRTGDIIGINGVPHGWNDFEVARDGQLLWWGVFNKDEYPWRFESGPRVREIEMKWQPDKDKNWDPIIRS